MPNLSEYELTQLLKRVGGGLGPPSGSCPEAEELRAYHHQELAPARGGEVRTHLIRCKKCLTALRQIMYFDALWEEAPEKFEKVHEEHWAKIVQSMQEGEGEASDRPEPAVIRLPRPARNNLQNLLKWLWPRPALIFGIVLVFFALAQWYALSQKPRDWDNPHYQALITLPSEVLRAAHGGEVPGEDAIEKAKGLMRNDDWGEAKAVLHEHLNAHQQDWRASYLLGLAHLRNARRIVVIDFYFDREQLHQAIAFSLRALENTGNNPAAREQVLWLLARAYAMAGDYAKAAEQYRAILQLQYPGQVKRAQAENALRDLAALLSAPMPLLDR